MPRCEEHSDLICLAGDSEVQAQGIHELCSLPVFTSKLAVKSTDTITTIPKTAGRRVHCMCEEIVGMKVRQSEYL